MKTKKTLIISVAFLCSALLMTACKKKDISILNSDTFHSIVTIWHDQFSKSHASTPVTSTVNNIVSMLSYDDVLIVKNSLNRTVYFIKKNSSSHLNQYLALVQTGNNIQAEGIYETTNLSQIEKFVNSGILPAGEKITVYSLLEKPIVQWETNSSGKSLLRMAQNKNTLSTKTLQTKLLSAFVEKKVLSAPVTPPECTDWYWVTFDIETGNILDVTYLYTTCTEGTGGGGGSGGETSGDALVCEESALGNINDSYATSGMEEITTTSASAAERTRSYKWKIYTGLTWTAKSHEIGIQHYETNDGMWHWTSLAHNTVSIDGFWMGGSISCAMNSATPSVYDQYAGMNLNYTMNFEWVCKGSPFARHKDASSSVLIEVNQTMD